jgi:broad specificity phosphatase PhoE
MEGKPQWKLQKAARKAKLLLPDFTPPGGETVAQVEHRCSTFFSDLCSTMFEQCMQQQSTTAGYKEVELADEQNHVLLVSHGGLIRCMLQQFVSKFGCDMQAHQQSYLRVCPNTGVSRFIVRLDGISRESTVSCQSLFNTDHLHREVTIIH